ncbi:MAG: hypothetical protein AAGI07_00935 [Bacteroidota bacterium]
MSETMPVLSLLQTEEEALNLPINKEHHVLWSGYIYQHSKSHTFRFLIDSYRIFAGDKSKSLPYTLVYFPGS